MVKRAFHKELARVIDWRLEELERLGVSITLNRLIEREDIVALGADAIVIATEPWIPAGHFRAPTESRLVTS